MLCITERLRHPHVQKQTGRIPCQQLQQRAPPPCARRGHGHQTLCEFTSRVIATNEDGQPAPGDPTRRESSDSHLRSDFAF